MTSELFERTVMGLIRELSRGMNAEPFLLHEKYDDAPEGHSPLELLLTRETQFQRTVLRRIGFGDEGWRAKYAQADLSDPAVFQQARADFIALMAGNKYEENSLEYLFFVMLPLLMDSKETYSAVAGEIHEMAAQIGVAREVYTDLRHVVSAICGLSDEITITSEKVIRLYGPILRYLGVPTKMYMCQTCCCCYDAIRGPFSNLPEDWKCPDCGAAKDSYKLVEGAYTLSRGELPEIGSRDPGQAKLKPRRH